MLYLENLVEKDLDSGVKYKINRAKRFLQRQRTLV